jgi:hypothetical protein
MQPKNKIAIWNQQDEVYKFVSYDATNTTKPKLETIIMKTG